MPMCRGGFDDIVRWYWLLTKKKAIPGFSKKWLSIRLERGAGRRAVTGGPGVFLAGVFPSRVEEKIGSLARWIFFHQR